MWQSLHAFGLVPGFCHGRAQRFQNFQDAGADLPRLGMAVDLLLGEDKLAVDAHVKDAAGAWNHVPAFDINFDFALVENFVRQTDGNGCVVSSRAVFNDNVHQSLLHESASFYNIIPNVPSLRASIVTASCQSRHKGSILRQNEHSTARAKKQIPFFSVGALQIIDKSVLFASVVKSFSCVSFVV